MIKKNHPQESADYKASMYKASTLTKKWESVFFSRFVKGEWRLHNKDETFVGLNYCLAPRCLKQSVKKISSPLKAGGFKINFGCLVKFKMPGRLLP